MRRLIVGSCVLALAAGGALSAAAQAGGGTPGPHHVTRTSSHMHPKSKKGHGGSGTTQPPK